MVDFGSICGEWGNSGRRQKKTGLGVLPESNRKLALGMISTRLLLKLSPSRFEIGFPVSTFALFLFRSYILKLLIRND